MSQSEHNSIKIEEENEREIEEEDMENSAMPIEEDEEVHEGENEEPHLTKKRTHRKLQISNFIMKTYRILEDRKNSDIVDWTDEGNCFIVKNKDKFTKQILPKYFKHNKFSSFVRQLNMYDFHKIRKQKEIPIFKHKYFKMNSMELLHKIKRKSGEEGKDEQLMSKKEFNLSQELIGEAAPQKNRLNNGHNNIQGEIEALRKENGELQHSIAEMGLEINQLEGKKERRKQKLVKIITSLMFFVHDQQPTEQPSEEPTNNNLRYLQQHFMKDEQPLSFTEYTQKLTHLYGSIKKNLL